MKGILHSDWLPEWAKLDPLGISYKYVGPARKSSLFGHIKDSGHWPHSFLPFYCP